MSTVQRSAPNLSGTAPVGGASDYLLTDGQGHLTVVVDGSAATPTTDAADGLTGATAPLYAIQIGGVNGNGDLEALALDSNDALKTSNIGVTLNTTGQVTISTSSTLIRSANSSRASILIANTSASVPIYIGMSSVTATTGHWVGPNQAISLPVTSSIYGVVSTGTVTVTFLEIE